MDFTELNTLLDNAIQFFTGFAIQKQNYESQLADKDNQLAEKDKTIADLTAQLKTVTATARAEETEINSLHDKLTNLNNLINGQSAPSTLGQTSDPAQPFPAAS
ncbi:hypothetical protein G7B40_001615 [Aetokthonos hydrillicola Thurmond2011]|jgi:ABC-type transporter Mla subunit MlaD|uniref:Uncharacterized protein n=1 Tax=Aetokthonos hydrillicola Thurmond2011 TaxID=2712845 RepID=A0AAP5M8I0_9CYAN|nr:hypothetical protein [Aetokthonos hydrillicola]MBO3462980.1 hypothetical protein [Aetokthonos hydrillicola CCALA 1050]MBW4591276.1 hypothetical protein [Aetokthonos hydrillicola CCALA 1050]MDR9893284.1 hypothetical protein [Aetokthonos hydrillicola Thurmond2011]